MSRQAWVGFCNKGLVLKWCSVLQWEQSLRRSFWPVWATHLGDNLCCHQEKEEVSYHIRGFFVKLRDIQALCCAEQVGRGGATSQQLAPKVASVYKYIRNLQVSNFRAFCHTLSLGHFYPVTVMPTVYTLVLSSGPSLRLMVPRFLQYRNKFSLHRNTW